MRSSSFPPPLVSYAHANLRVVSSGVVIVARWLAPPTADDMRSMRLALRPWVMRHEAFCSLNVIDIQHASPMSEDARLEVAQTQKEFEGRQRGLANVIEGTGFWAASLRSVASGLAFVSRVKFEQRIFNTVDPAAAWLATLFPDGAVDTAEVVRATMKLRVEGERSGA